MKEQSLSLPTWNERFLSVWEEFKTGICEVVPKCKTKIQRICCRARSVPIILMARCSLAGTAMLSVMDMADANLHQWWVYVVAAVTCALSVATVLQILIPLYRKESELWDE